MKFKGRGVLQVTGRNSIEEDAIANIAKAMQEEIDREVMYTIEAESLVESKGWVMSPVERPWGPFTNWSTETAQWCHINCTGDYKLIQSHWYFEKPAEATAFTLRWTT